MNYLMNRKDFVDYANLCFTEFGDRVRYWITFCGPWSLAYTGYGTGTIAPGRGASSSTVETFAARSLLPPDLTFCQPYRTRIHRDASGDPGTEPYLVAHHQLLAHAAVVKLYRDNYQGGSSWIRVYPAGIKDFLAYVKNKYDDPVIYISENGIDERDDPSLTRWESLTDHRRVSYYQKHLSYLKRAITEDEVKVKGYFIWSLTDNFEWDASIYSRFGNAYIDYDKGYARHPKLSAEWFRVHLLKPSQSPRDNHIVNINKDSKKRSFMSEEGPLVGPNWRPKRSASLCISLGVKLGNDTDSSDVATNCCETLVAGAVSPAVRDHG
ncbi:hypothetical protein RJ639_015821 [Escallonia herrerae]|uniref:Beta-glucosidase n=1 Tax=Escallonia herrerae TaxID=1293975 RepID=A0AA89AMG9_9ASTE|nr:hypothetical protein RJ639_015821 [Escallonia herrerae]